MPNTSGPSKPSSAVARKKHGPKRLMERLKGALRRLGWRA